MIEFTVDSNSSGTRQFERWLSAHMKSLRKEVRAHCNLVAERFIPQSEIMVVVHYAGWYGKGIARCRPDDDFSANLGIELAIDRAIDDIADQIFAREVAGNTRYRVGIQLTHLPVWNRYDGE
jgi:hypothetical protein